MSFRIAVLVLLAALAGLGALSSWQLREVLFGVRSMDGPVDEPVTLEQPELTSSAVTFEKTLEDGTKITLTCTQRVGEDYDDFVARCRDEWKALCAAVGG